MESIICDGIMKERKKVKEKLEELDLEKSPGNDSIQSAILRSLASEFTEPLDDIFRSSMETGQDPENWRNANVSLMIYKSGSKKRAGKSA